MSKYGKLLIFILFPLITGACASAAVTSANLAYDHYRIEKNLEDRYITIQAEGAIYAAYDIYKKSNISVMTFDKMTLLVGQVPDKQTKQQVQNIIATIPEIDHIYNFLTIGKNASTKTMIKDTWLTAKIKARLITTRSLDASSLKVVTEDGVVYIMGRLEAEQAEIATQKIRQTKGVKKVITMYEYVHITLRPVKRDVITD